jgi:hypothetical protein
VAHELGRHAGGDTRPGRWIDRAREAVERAILRTTNARSRRRAVATDAFAARRAGREAHRRIHAYAPAFESYWAVEVVPVLESGRRPDVGGGFARFVATERVRQAADGQLEGEPDESADALGLVTDPAALETRILEHLLGPEDLGDFEPVAWDEVGTVVYLERARAMAEHFAPVLAGRTAGGLGEDVASLDRLAGDVSRVEPDVRADDAKDVARMLLVSELTVALAGARWRVEAPPGELVTCRRGDERLAPAEVVDALENGDLAAAEWRGRTEALGIASLPLGCTHEAADPAGSTAR